MRFKALVIIIVLILTQIIFDSCCKINTSFTIKEVYIANLNNSGAVPEEVSDTIGSGVSKNAFGIRILLYTSSKIASNTTNNFQFISSSYALACDEDYLLTNKITTFKIYTLNDFDENHKAGAEVTELFNGLNKEYGPYITIEQKLNELNSVLTDLPDYFDVYLMKAPTEGDEHRFKITMELNDGYVADLTTENVILF